MGDVRKRSELGPVDASVLTRLKQLTKFEFSYFYQPWDDEYQTVAEIRQRAVCLVAGIWQHCRTFEWLTDRAKYDPDNGVRRSCIQELARGWKGDPQTLTILQDGTQSDDSWNIRQSCVQEFARGWKDDLQTLSFLKNRAQNDRNNDARQTCVQELLRGWKADVGVQDFLRNLP